MDGEDKIERIVNETQGDKTMANLKLKKTILEVVENQLKENNPPCTKDIYEQLLNAGYSRSEAKDKIGAVILTEIYDILQEGQSFDEEKYKNSLEEMLKQSLDCEDGHHIETEWNAWDDLVEKGYECLEDQRETEGLVLWQDAWNIFCSIMEQTRETDTLYGLMDELDYVYPIDEWLEDYELELGSAGKDTERIELCQKILEMFDWQEDDDSCFKCGIGESLFRQGKIAEAYEYYEKWLADEPQNADGINSFSWILFENGDAGKAYEVVRRATWGVSCYVDNSILFMRAKQLADYVGKEDESKWYQQQLDKFEESIGEWEMNDEELFDEFTMPGRIPVVKEKKIYPNDPCPCGSGKKYKKCCGKP